MVDIKELKFKKDSITYTIELTKLLFISDNLNGQGTMVWQGARVTRWNRSSKQVAVAVKDSWIDPLWKYMEGMILATLNKHMIRGVPTLIHKEQIKASYPPTISNKQANSSTHFLQLFLTKCGNGGTYSLRTLSHIITEPVSELITKLACWGEFLIAFLNYVVGEFSFVGCRNLWLTGL